MLKILRKKGVMKKVIWFVAVIIILSFGVFGTAYLIAGNNPTQNTHAGKMFNKKISLDTFQQALEDVRIQTIIQYGDKYNEVRPYLNFEQKAWDRLIILEEADRQGIKVTNDEVINTIRNYAFFQQNNQFDTPRYNEIVRYVFDTTPRAFEESTRDSIKVSKYIGQNTETIEITDKELFNTFKKQNEQVQINYISFKPEDYKDQASVTEQEITDYFAENKLEFLQPFSVNVKYVSLDLVEGEDPDAENAAIIATANTIYDEAFETNDLSQAATNNGLATQESGFFSREEPNLTLGWSFDVLNQIFQLDAGEILPPIESDTNVLLIQLAETREAYVPELKEVRSKVEDKVRLINAKDIAQTKAQKALNTIKESYHKTSDISQTAENLELTTHQTPEFTRGQYLPKIGISKSFQEAAFGLNDSNKISDVVETQTGYHILHLESFIPADPEEFVEKKDELKQTVLAEKRSAAFSKHLSSLRVKAKLVDYISKQQEEIE